MSRGDHEGGDHENGESPASGLGRLLREPGWGWRDAAGGVPRPGWAAIAREVARSVNVLASRRNLSAFLMFAGFVVAGPLAALAFVARGPTLALGCVAIAYFWVYTVLTNTVWWHRFASHRAFAIRSGALRRALRLLSPIYLPVEAYVIPHRVHHAGPDRPGDPYTPLSGYLACMSTEWTTGVLDPEMTPEDFAVACRLIEHTGVPLHDLAGFRRWGTVQTIGSLLSDLALATVLHVGALAALGGTSAVCAAYTGLLVGHFLNLDFNYTAHGRGRARHREGWDFHRDDLSLNQHGPGFIGGEWHNNHHLFPGSMRSGFLPGQLDVPYALVRGLEALGLVGDVQDHRSRFRAAVLAGPTSSVPGAAPPPR